MKLTGSYYVKDDDKLNQSLYLSNIVISREFMLKKQIESLIITHNFHGAIVHNFDTLDMIQLGSGIIHENGCAKLNPLESTGRISVQGLDVESSVDKVMVIPDSEGDLIFFVSNNDGKSFLPVVPNTITKFDEVGSVLALQIIMNKGTLQPSLNEISILF